MEYQFNQQLAIKYGVEQAVILHNFAFWIMKNEANDRHFYEGKTWTYNSVKAMTVLFPFFNKDKIRRLIDSLIKKGAIYKGNFNKSSYDRTSWYALDESVLSIYRIKQVHLANLPNEFGKNAKPIPDTKTTYSKPNKKQDINSPETEKVSGGKAKKTSVAKKKDTKLYNEMKDYYLSWFQQKVDSEYYFQAKDGKKINDIIKKLKFSIREAGKVEVSDANVLEAFKMLLNKLPEFYKTSDLSTIDSKYNTIISQIKKPKRHEQKNRFDAGQSMFNPFSPNYIGDEEIYGDTF